MSNPTLTPPPASLGLRHDFQSRYRIDSTIGSGGAGVVHAGYDYVLKRKVAIKRLRNDKHAADQETTESLLHEAEAICQIPHPNIVSVYDVGSDEQGVYIVMELLDGFDFEHLIQDGYLMMEQFQELAIQSLEGLVAAHEMKNECAPSRHQARESHSCLASKWKTACEDRGLWSRSD